MTNDNYDLCLCLWLVYDFYDSLLLLLIINNDHHESWWWSMMIDDSWFVLQDALLWSSESHELSYWVMNYVWLRCMILIMFFTYVMWFHFIALPIRCWWLHCQLFILGAEFHKGCYVCHQLHSHCEHTDFQIGHAFWDVDVGLVVFSFAIVKDMTKEDMAKIPGRVWSKHSSPSRRPKVAKLQQYHHSRLVLDERFTLHDMLRYNMLCLFKFKIMRNYDNHESWVMNHEITF